MNQVNWDEYKKINQDMKKKDDDINRLEAMDVVAMVIAMLQLVMPIALIFMGVALLMMLLFRFLF